MRREPHSAVYERPQPGGRLPAWDRRMVAAVAGIRRPSWRHLLRFEPNGSGAGQTEAARDDHALNFTGTLADLQDLGISEESSHRKVLHEAVATEDLRGGAGGGDGCFRRVELCHSSSLFDVLDRATAG